MTEQKDEMGAVGEPTAAPAEPEKPKSERITIEWGISKGLVEARLTEDSTLPPSLTAIHGIFEVCKGQAISSLRMAIAEQMKQKPQILKGNNSMIDGLRRNAQKMGLMK